MFIRNKNGTTGEVDDEDDIDALDVKLDKYLTIEAQAIDNWKKLKTD